MSNPNRRAFSIRMSLAEQQELANLCAYYKRDPKTVLKQAFFLMVESTAQLKAQLKKEADDAKATADASSDGELSTGTSSEPASGTETGSSGTDEAGD